MRAMPYGASEVAFALSPTTNNTTTDSMLSVWYLFAISHTPCCTSLAYFLCLSVRNFLIDTSQFSVFVAFIGPRNFLLSCGLGMLLGAGAYIMCAKTHMTVHVTEFTQMISVMSLLPLHHPMGIAAQGIKSILVSS